ncbi:MAG TPA: hypothetical protein VFB66_32330 [Tepidisphaeraceae bacterium]|nr:hypothetical protein [Tepidisphaeraceae bacterium]
MFPTLRWRLRGRAGERYQQAPRRTTGGAFGIEAVEYVNPMSMDKAGDRTYRRK